MKNPRTQKLLIIVAVIVAFTFIGIFFIFTPQKKQNPNINDTQLKLDDKKGDTWSEVSIGGREFINTTPKIIRKSDDGKLTLIQNNDGTYVVESLDYKKTEEEIRKELNISSDITFTISVPGAASPKYYEDIIE